MQPSKHSIGTRIKAARQAKKMTQSALAEAVGRTRSLVNVWEPGKSTPSITDLQNVAKVLDVSVQWLATGEAPPYFGRPQWEPPARIEIPLSELYRVLEHLVRQIDHIRQQVDRLAEDKAPSGKA